MTIVDAKNNRLSDVGFHYIFYFGSDIVLRHAGITYTLSSADSVTLKIFDPIGREVTTLLNKEFQPAGWHTYFYDGTGLTNGVYEARITASSIDSIRKFILRTDDVTTLKATPPLVKSGRDGNLEISYRALGLGYRSTLNLAIIVDSITVLLVKEGYQDFVQTIRLDTSKADERIFRLQAE